MKRLLRTHPDLVWALGLAVLGAVIYLPRLGSFPLWDPWEPHYSQVAWEMQRHDTWLSPWYRDSDHWWSKPILMLWMLRASFAILWDATTQFADNELAARLPFALTAISGGILHYGWVRRLFGRAVAGLAAVALLTAPQYLLIGRQVMADMPFVVAFTAAMGYLAVGLFTRRERVPGDGRLRAFARTEWPFAVFWVLQAVAVLAKGFVPPALAAMVLVAYALLTFRWRDYDPPRPWRRYLATRLPLAGVLAAAGGGLVLLLPRQPAELRVLLAALVAAVVTLAIGLVVLRELPPSRHASRLLARMRAAWGLPLFLAVAAPWFVYMTLEHGWPYWREFVFYHHLGRAAGTIDKPGGTFDFFVRQVGFGLFPWSALLPVALWRFVGQASPGRSTAERRNLYVLLAFLVPYLFFSVSGTKFAHYVFPVVPFAVVLVSATLVWLGKRGEATVPLAEPSPALGPPVPAAHDRGPWWQQAGARGDLAMIAAVTLIAFGILAHDLVLDFRHFLRLFVYYQNRAAPPGYQPYLELQLVFFPIAGVIALWLLGRWVRRWHVVAIAAGAVVLACYLGWATMPAMGATFTYEPLYDAYQRLARPGDAIGQYNTWQQPERSVIFLFQNRAQHLRNDKLASAFLARPGRKFVIVDRDRLPDLRRVARDLGVKLHVVSDAHPYARLVSDEPDPEDVRKVRDHLLTSLPASATVFDGVFDGAIRLVGYQLDPEEVVPGERVTASFFYRVEKPVDGDWQIFVHGDGPGGAGPRLRADHFPVDALYPTNEWQEGEIIRDDFQLEVPADYPHHAFHLWTGFYIGERRMRLTGGAHDDGDDRLRGPLVRVRRR